MLVTEQNYQLNIEDAEQISGFDVVLFCDASVEDIEAVKFERVIPNLKTDFSMHSVSPSFVLGICEKLFKKQPETYQLHIKGYSWEFMQEMSPRAKENIKKAEALLKSFIKEKLLF